MKIKPYEFQQDAIDKFFDYCKENPKCDIAMEFPTGSGKSVIIGAICERLSRAKKRVIVLCRQKELVKQNSERLHQICPDVSIGWYCSGLGRKDLDQDVIFATVQSVAKKGFDFGEVALVITDEAHQIPPKSESQYFQFITDIRKANPNVRTLGLTATMSRTGSGEIYGDGKVYSELIHAVPLKLMLKEGTITPWTIPSVEAVDMSHVKIKGTDYDLEEMGEAFIDKLMANVADIVKASAGRKKILCFATTVRHASLLKDALEQVTGERVCLVTGETPKVIREILIDDFKSGGLRWVVNCNVLTTGFDAPNVDLVAVCRATQSSGLFYQIIGRGMRTASGKEDFLVLDFGGNFDRLGDPADANYGRSERAPERLVCPKCSQFAMAEDIRCGECGTALKVKACPKCNTVVAIDTVICPGELSEDGSLFSEPCRRDLAVKRCRTTKDEDGKEVSGCDCPIDKDAEFCVKCLKEVERKKAGSFEERFQRAASEPVKLVVMNVEYFVHRPREEGKQPSMRVEYLVDSFDPEKRGNLSRHRVSEWVCIEHEGFAGKKAMDWWKLRSRNPFPDDVFDACGLAARGACLEPETIVVKQDGQWKRIVSAELGNLRPLVEMEAEESPF